MSLVLAYDRDDLPDGYPEQWEHLVEQLLPRSEYVAQGRSIAQREHGQRFYARASRNAAWRAERNAAARAARASKRSWGATLARVLDHVPTTGEVSAARVVAALGLPSTAVRKALSQAAKRGLIVRVRFGLYRRGAVRP